MIPAPREQNLIYPLCRFLQRERSSLGNIIPRKQMETEISKIEIIEFDPPSFQLHVHSIGRSVEQLYICARLHPDCTHCNLTSSSSRLHPCTLINDLGETLESAAHLSHLCRVQQVRHRSAIVVTALTLC